MKKQFLLIAFLFLSFALVAPESTFAKKDKAATACSGDCKDACKCDHANGQKCDSKCGTSKKKASKASTKEHKCSSTCKEGKHSYAHGEKGHNCGNECK